MTTRVAIVTGAAQNIGRAIALRLAKDGFDVAVDGLPRKIDRLESLAKEIRDMGRKSIVLTADVTNEEDVKRMVEQTVESLGRLDVMVANAGIGRGGWKPIQEVDLAPYEEMWAVNIRGTVLCYKYAAQQMIKQKSGGRIIGASSIAGFKGYAGIGGYVMSKFAIRGLTQSCARDLHEHNITVNAYAPGVIDTDTTRWPEDESNGGPCSTIKKYLHISPETRTGQCDDVASLVSYLASLEAHFITGQTFIADGGATF